MADFFVQKWDKEKHPKIVEAHEGREVYAVFYDKGRFPRIIGKALSKEQAEKIVNHYAKNTLHTKNINIRWI